MQMVAEWVQVVETANLDLWGRSRARNSAALGIWVWIQRLQVYRVEPGGAQKPWETNLNPTRSGPR